MKQVKIVDIHPSDYFFFLKESLIGLTVFLVEKHAYQDQEGWWNGDILFDRVESDMGLQIVFFYGIKLEEI